jgi:hypothetical protein
MRSLLYDERLTDDELETFIKGVVDQPGVEGRTITIFASPELVTDLDLLAADRLRTVSLSLTYGVPVKQLATAAGTVNIIKVPSWQGRIGFAAFLDGVIRGL